MNLEKLILKEREYDVRMDTEVEPYLNGCKKERWVKPAGPAGRETGKGIHVLCYRTQEPRATVMISHGFTEAEPKYHEMIYYFLQNRYNVYFPEHCGHGLSYRLTQDASLVHVDRWERYAADLMKVSRLAKKENPDLPLVLYGHSMGGGIAAAAASLAPELYKRVVLSSPMIRPLTAKVPWGVSAAISCFQCLTGKEETYVAGQKPYAGAESFAESSGLSKPRFLRYDMLRQKHVELQTCAASYGWLYESLRMSGYLMKKGYRYIQAPILLLHSHDDGLVSVDAQKRFAWEVNKNGRTTCRSEEFMNMKHELFHGGDSVLTRYWREVFEFFSHING